VSINRRTAIAVRSIGVASAATAIAVGVAGSAFACSIDEFTPSAQCDNGKASIQVVDKDVSRTPVTITVTQGQTKVGEKKGVTGNGEGVTVSFPVAWQPSTTYTVTVVKDTDRSVVGHRDVTTPAQACATPAPPTSPASPSPSTTAPDTTTPATPATPATTAPAAPQPSGTASSSAPAVADTNAPSPAGGSTNLAETGGGSNTGMIAGIAAAFVAVGGGAVFLLRRRRPSARH
jgi:LPXTG-motif cell wall-anchored protein